MARVNTYLNFPGNTEEAFNFYQQVFNSEITSLTRMKDMPRPEGAPSLTQDQGELIMNVQMSITNGHVLMATDALEELGHHLKVGNNVTIGLDLDTQEEGERIYNKLLEGSPENSGPLAPMPWGALWGSCEDRFGIRWMISVYL
jgi:PhnB protein